MKPAAISTPRLLLIYACISAVYLLYLPHALPVLDDWTILQVFHQARAGGRPLLFLADLVDNRWWGQFRIFWAGFVPVYLLSFAAGFAAWPYCLLAWAAHLLTAVLLCRIVSLLAGEAWSGFAAGSVYAVFAAANNTLFWPLGNYYFQALALLAWFYFSWKKLSATPDHRYGWKDFALLIPAAFSGEQALPALVLLLPVTAWLFAEPEKRRSVLRFCGIHAAALAGLLGFYVLCLNRMPLLRNFQARYSGGGRWSPWPFALRLLASLGLNPRLAEWRPAWRLEPALVALLLLAAAAFFWGLRWCGPVQPLRRAKLFAWSVAASALTYVSVAFLPGIEWRYLYVPAAFLVAAGIAVLGCFPRQVRSLLVFLAVAYSLALSYFEIRQCWIRQSREAQAVLDAVAGARPIGPRDILIFAHAPHSMGPAPSFLLGASWALNDMLHHYTGAAEVQGARELLVNERGDLALYRRDSLAPFPRADVPRLRVFARDAAGRFLPKSFLALPAGGGRFQLVPLGPSSITVPAGPVALDQLRALPIVNDIYFAHPFTGPLPR
ncbi:MAG TPA: hypothetical protein VEU62_18690 [Bryobacterales bacterium]|nr:hypothetical protein [Bryobacterales bacterium]